MELEALEYTLDKVQEVNVCNLDSNMCSILIYKYDNLLPKAVFANDNFNIVYILDINQNKQICIVLS